MLRTGLLLFLSDRTVAYPSTPALRTDLTRPA